MSYKIAIGSSDGINVDLKFGEIKEFLIYEVDENTKFLEKRAVYDELPENTLSFTEGICSTGDKDCTSSCVSEGGGCGDGNGCSGPKDAVVKISVISDCRCVVCKKIGFQAQKQFEKKAISVFDVECSISEALEKITYYYGKIDRHETFRKEK